MVYTWNKIMKKLKQLSCVWITEGSDHLGGWNTGTGWAAAVFTGNRGVRLIICRPNRFRELRARSGNMELATNVGAEKKSKCLLRVGYLD